MKKEMGLKVNQSKTLELSDAEGKGRARSNTRAIQRLVDALHHHVTKQKSEDQSRRRPIVNAQTCQKKHEHVLP